MDKSPGGTSQMPPLRVNQAELNVPVHAVASNEEENKELFHPY